MKRDKKLQKYIDENLSEYRNDTFLEQLKSDLSPINTPTRRRNNRLYWTIAGATCVVMAIILVSVFAIAPLIKENGDKDTAQPSKYYSYANRTEITVSVTELNGVVNDIEFSEENPRPAHPAPATPAAVPPKADTSRSSGAPSGPVPLRPPYGSG